MASPAMPRNDAADRYSPQMADAFNVGGTRRAATRKSAGVRATRTPRAPMTAVTTAVAMIAPRTSGSVISLVQQLGETVFDPPSSAPVPESEEHERRVDAPTEDQEGERDAADLSLVEGGEQHRQHGVE